MADNQNEEIGSLTGIAAGAITGATVGSAVFPVFGTFAGALVGGIVGSQLGRTIGGGILNALDPSMSGAESVVHPHPAEPDEPQADLASQLERLGQLRTQGLITEEEFAAAKAKLLK